MPAPAASLSKLKMLAALALAGKIALAQPPAARAASAAEAQQHPPASARRPVTEIFGRVPRLQSHDHPSSNGDKERHQAASPYEASVRMLRTYVAHNGTGAPSNHTTPLLAGLWVPVAARQIARAQCSRVRGEQAEARPDAAGTRLDFFGYPEAENNASVVRCDIPDLPAFEAVRGSYQIVPTHPVTGLPQDPDNADVATTWGVCGASAHGGSFAFGTPGPPYHAVGEILDGGGNGAAEIREPLSLSIGEHRLAAGPATALRFEVCQSADHENFSLQQFKLEVQLSSDWAEWWAADLSSAEMAQLLAVAESASAGVAAVETQPIRQEVLQPPASVLLPRSTYAVLGSRVMGAKYPFSVKSADHSAAHEGFTISCWMMLAEPFLAGTRSVLHTVPHLGVTKTAAARTPSVQLRATGESKATGRYAVVLQATLRTRKTDSSPYTELHKTTQAITSRHHTVEVGEWVHMAVAVSRRKCQLFLRGELVGELMTPAATSLSHASFNFSSGVLVLGYANGGSSRGPIGLVDALVIHQIPFNCAEARQIAIHASPPSSAPPLSPVNQSTKKIYEEGDTVSAAAGFPVFLPTHVDGYTQHLDEAFKIYYRHLGGQISDAKIYSRPANAFFSGDNDTLVPKPSGWPFYTVFGEDETWARLLGFEMPTRYLRETMTMDAVSAREVAVWTNGLLLQGDRARLADRHGKRAGEESVPLFKQAAAAGDCRAMHRLGSMYLTGEWKPEGWQHSNGRPRSTAPRDIGSAVVRLLAKAGRGGCADADALAGHMLSTGLGNMVEDYAAAKMHYVAAALRGSLDGHVALGRLYLFGWPILDGSGYPAKDLPSAQPDDAMALMHYSWAARRTLADMEGSALPFTENVRLAEAMPTGLAGHGGKEDEILQWVQLNADNGNPQALMTMGRLHYAGQRGFARDPALARQYFQQAADQGVPEADFNLGVMHSRGEGVTNADTAEALRHFERAAEGGHIAAQNGLGVMHLHGQANVTRNRTKALGYFRMAAERGDGDGMANLAAVLRMAAPVVLPAAEREANLTWETNETQAFAWAARSSARGHTKGTYLLAECYRDGIGTTNNEPDIRAAAYLMKRVGENAPSLGGILLRQALEFAIADRTAPSHGTAAIASLSLNSIGAQLGIELAASNALFLLEDSQLGGQEWPTIQAKVAAVDSNNPVHPPDSVVEHAVRLAATAAIVAHRPTAMLKFADVLFYGHATVVAATKFVSTWGELPVSKASSAPRLGRCLAVLSSGECVVAMSAGAPENAKAKAARLHIARDWYRKAAALGSIRAEFNSAMIELSAGAAEVAAAHRSPQISPAKGNRNVGALGAANEAQRHADGMTRVATSLARIRNISMRVDKRLASSDRAADVAAGDSKASAAFLQVDPKTAWQLQDNEQIERTDAAWGWLPAGLVIATVDLVDWVVGREAWLVVWAKLAGATEW